MNGAFFDRPLCPNWLLEATLIGSAAQITETRVEIDPELPGAVFPLAGWAAVEENGNFGKSNYNGLITVLSIGIARASRRLALTPDKMP